MNKKIIYVDMDDTLCDYSGGYIRALDKNPRIPYPQSQVDFYRNLAPLESAQRGFMTLFNDGKFDVYILTAPSVRNPLSYMEKRIWVEKFLGFRAAGNLIICSNKGLLMGDYLIDDKASGKGQDQFTGKLIQFGTEGFEDWNKVLEYFRSIEVE